MSTYGISGTSPLQDLSDDPEVLFTNKLKTLWDDSVAGVAKNNIDFGYEPDQNSTKGFIIKIEENFTDIAGIDLADRYNQFDIYMDAHIWERDTTTHITGKSGRNLYKMKRYVERFIIQNCNSLQPEIKHVYLLTSRNVREPERQDWHHAVVTFRMVTWKVNAQ